MASIDITKLVSWIGNSKKNSYDLAFEKNKRDLEAIHKAYDNLYLRNKDIDSDAFTNEQRMVMDMELARNSHVNRKLGHMIIGVANK